jgi:serine/threonine protein phosphatase 1
MLQRLRDFFRPPSPPRLPAVPVGARYYAIGDIHGRLDLYETLIAAIEAEIAAAPGLAHRIILLGDLIDRGPDSAGVVARTQAWQQARNVQVLAGNHEEMFLAAFEKPEALRHFLKHGGRETLLSYGLSSKQLAALLHEDCDDRHGLCRPRLRGVLCRFRP